jgi:hypothetical protein
MYLTDTRYSVKTRRIILYYCSEICTTYFIIVKGSTCLLWRSQDPDPHFLTWMQKLSYRVVDLDPVRSGIICN